MYKRKNYLYPAICSKIIFLLVLSLSFSVFAQSPEIYLQMGYKAGSNVSSNAMVFSNDGSLLAANSGDNTIRIWESVTGREVQTLLGHGGSIKSLVFLPDNRRIISGGNDKTVRLWDIGSGRQLRLFSGHQKDVECVAVSQDGSRLASSDDSTVKVWNIDTGALLATVTVPVESNAIQGYVSPIRALAFLPDNSRIIFVNLRGEVFIAGLNERRITSTISNSKLNHYSSLKILGFTSAGKVALGGLSVLIFIDPDSLEIIKKSIKDNIWIEYMAADGLMVAGTAMSMTDSKLFVFDANLQERFSFPLDDNITNKAYSPANNQLAISSFNDQLKLYDLETGKELQNLSAKAFTPRGGTFSMDGAYISIDAQVPVKNNSVSRTNTWANVWNLNIAAREKVFDRTERTEKILKMFASGNPAEREQASKIVTAQNYYDGEKETFSEYDELNKCFYYVEVASFYGSPWVNIYRIEAKDKYDLGVRSVQYRSQWKILKQFKAHEQNVTATAVSYKHGYVATGSTDKTIKLFSYPAMELLRTFKGHAGEITQLTFSPDVTRLLSQSSDQTTRLWDVASGRELARFINFTDGEWIVITPQGYYNASANGDRNLNVRVGNNVYGIENYREAFFRPDLVKLALAGGSLAGYRSLADIKRPPQVSIVDTPRSVNADNVTVKLHLTDNGGGIGDIRLYLNGSAVVMDSRAVKITAKGTKSLAKEYTLKLISGRNIIKAVAFNGDNTMQSNEVTQEITASFAAAGKPSLFALVIGINEFKNPKLKLNYPVADADLFAATLKKVTAGLFDKVNIRKLTSADTTTSASIIREIKSFQSLRPDDLFVFYIASHGTVDEGEYFLITSNVGSLRTEKLKTDAISQNMLKDAIANIPATKKLIIIDTCNAGALGEAIQVAMLTRGMSEDTALKILSRAVGSTILSASTSVQEALEGYQGHGLFTYVLTEGLKGKADKGKTGYVKTTELADYVDNEVPLLAEKVFKRAQYPTISISGQAFPIGKVK